MYFSRDIFDGLVGHVTTNQEYLVAQKVVLS